MTRTEVLLPLAHAAAVQYHAAMLAYEADTITGTDRVMEAAAKLNEAMDVLIEEGSHDELDNQTSYLLQAADNAFVAALDTDATSDMTAVVVELLRLAMSGF